MKKTLSIALLGLSTIAFSQISVSTKAHILLETSSAKWENVRESVQNSGKKSAGFNVGLSTKIDIPATSLFAMPEIYYTHYTNSYTESITHTELKANHHKIDVPVLLGYNILSENISAFAGPVLSYNLAKEGQWKDFKENAKNNFTVGYQFGGQVVISNLVLSARYEGSFKKDERKFINSILSETIKYHSRPSFIMLGLGYKF